jgi:hypothetical protein
MNYRGVPDSRAIPYHVARGDPLLQDRLFKATSIAHGIRLMETKYGAGQIAYTPELTERFMQILERRFTVDDGHAALWSAPHYAPYEDEELAASLGIDVSGDIATRKETHDEAVFRLLDDAARECAQEASGLATVAENFANEAFARYGTAEEKPYFHSDPDKTLFRNPQRGWASIDRPIATSDKTNPINLYESVPEYTHNMPHESWLNK